MIEIVSIGAELLTGQTVNTNASVIAKALLKRGFGISHVTTVPDHHNPMKKAIEEAMSRASVVITTGGLGPTGDDITRSTLAEIFESELVHDAKVATELEKRYGKDLETLADQATVIKGAHVIPNPIGTAPGFILKKGEKTVIVLPGAPVQMQEMLEKSVIPYLEETHKRHLFQHAVYLFLMSEQHVDPFLRAMEEKHPKVEFGVCPSYGTLSIYLRAHAESQDEAEERFAPILFALREKFKHRIFSEKYHDIEYAVHEQFIARGLTLACAESCTGGRIAARLTKISGCSDYFLGSLVTYSNQMKTSVLNVNPETLHAHGAVSRETVIEMVQGTLSVSGADYAVAVSGITGPTGGTQEKPVGTVWGAIGHKKGDVFAGLLSLKGTRKRSTLIEYSATYLLSHLWRYIQFDIPPFEES
ncbi:CinA family nicotinamide mononucleotide deamidase-related protein [Simkania sp.]|uniref:CinA family nicotinamide mononucleotide deamidase-related protein n=1 Tax=Simkania sp. TaxID=34094 RepID=UPI003B51DA1D